MTNSRFIGKVYHRFDELPSTNDFARKIAAKSEPAEGTVVRADSQSAGRGQFGSQWESEAGKNLTLSIIFRPIFLPIERQFLLSQAVSLALVDCLTGLLADGLIDQFAKNSNQQINKPSNQRPKIKWPNDIYIGDKKVAGILIENSISGGQIQTSIVGIGLNANQTVFLSDAPNPISLAQATGRFFDLDELLKTMLNCLETRYLQLKNWPLSAASLNSDYCQDLYRFGQKSRFLNPFSGEEFFGKIVGANSAGQLKIENENGAEQCFGNKEIRFL